MLKDFDNAIAVGESVVTWAQSKGQASSRVHGYVSLITNLAFARLIRGDVNKATEEMREAFELLPDEMARQDYSLALIGTSMFNKALDVLAEDTIAPSVSSESELDVVAKFGGGSCTYLIRAIALRHLNQPKDESANLAAYLRQPQPADTLSIPDKWRKKAWSALLADRRPCGNLTLIPFVHGALTE